MYLPTYEQYTDSSPPDAALPMVLPASTPASIAPYSRTPATLPDRHQRDVLPSLEPYASTPEPSHPAALSDRKMGGRLHHRSNQKNEPDCRSPPHFPH